MGPWLFRVLADHFREWGYWTVPAVLLLEKAGVPLAAEAVAEQRERGHPNRSSEQVEHYELAPGHAQDAGQRPCDDAHSEDEAGEGDRNMAMAGE